MRMVKIITTRRIVQIFFFLLFVWFCVVGTLGERWWQLRGWPVNWFLQLDPLAGLGVLLATHTLYAGLLWGVVILVSTLLLGRFFCGWICPMGALQQFIGYLGLRKEKRAARIRRNQPHAAQRIKYWLLFFLLSAAAADLLRFLLAGPVRHPAVYAGLILFGVLIAWLLNKYQQLRIAPRTAFLVAAIILLAGIWQWRFPHIGWLAASLQTGLLDPIAFIYRAFTLVLLPIVDQPLHLTAPIPRLYAGGWLIGVLFWTAVLLCLRIPRFYCRFICPLGALLGLLSRWAVWRMGKSEDRCRECHQCEGHCEGACAPSRSIHTGECVLCLNCMDHCPHELMGYGLQPSAAGEVPGPDLSRRYVISAVTAGIFSVPAARLTGRLAGNSNPQLIRPPGALAEKAFLTRCIKCGQCMRICPTNVIHPAGWLAGPEGIWTPVLNFRIGTSGCQHNCVACSHICPTAALRPLTVDERMGRRDYAAAGPLRTGMAFVDRGRCLPWAMDTPCIVCQENCPVSPKAIFTRTEYRPIRNGTVRVRDMASNRIMITGKSLSPGALGSGDYFATWQGQPPLAIRSNTENSILLGETAAHGRPPAEGGDFHIVVRLQKPYVDPHHCIGCGVCEHECPVQGRRAIRVTAENASRQPHHRLIIRQTDPKGGS
jgi:polyferredoxin